MANAANINVSIAAFNVSTGASFSYGSTNGMVEGSVVKLDILLSALWQAQNADQNGLTSTQQSYAAPMIENSDNDSADSLFQNIGGNATMSAANKAFGLSSTNLDPGGQWGLSTTSAADQILLLKQVAMPGVLSAASQAYTKQLMDNVEDDQTWGVGAAADAGSDFENKNGWLAVDSDNDLWLVNSDGIIVVHGQKVLMSVLTQHNPDFATGKTLVESLAKATAPAVAF